MHTLGSTRIYCMNRIIANENSILVDCVLIFNIRLTFSILERKSSSQMFIVHILILIDEWDNWIGHKRLVEKIKNDVIDARSTVYAHI